MSKYPIPDFLKIDLEKTVEKLVKCIKEHVSEAKASGVVIGLSGGVDSSTTTALSVRALGPGKVKVLVMPDKESSRRSIEDAKRVIEILGLRDVVYVDITPIVEAVLRLGGDSYDTAPRIPKANVKARARMILLYYYANKENRLVVGSSDRSEWLLGYFTKWGDAAADFYPLLGLYKTQVRMLAEYLGIPEDIAWKPSSPDLWPGHKARDELGAEYDVLDPILYYMFDVGLRDEEIAEKTGAPLELVKAVRQRHLTSGHKRSPLKVCIP